MKKRITCKKTIDKLKYVLSKNLKPIKLPKNCPYFRKGKINYNCLAVSGWISVDQETEQFCSSEFATCGNYIKAVLKERLKEKFFISFIVKEYSKRISNFIISGMDIFLQEALEEFFCRYELIKSIGKNNIEAIVDRMEALGDERKEKQRVLGTSKTKYGRNSARRRNNLDTSLSLLSEC